MVFVDLIELVKKDEDAGLQFVCNESVKLIPHSFEGEYRSYSGYNCGINRIHKSMLDYFILIESVFVLGVGSLKPISGDVKMTIEVMAMKLHGNLGCPNCEVVASSLIGSLKDWVKLN